MGKAPSVPKREPFEMINYIGVDVGTGSVRAALVSYTGEVIITATKEINISNPQPDFYMQSSVNVWEAVKYVIKEILSHSWVKKDEIRGIGFDATCSLVVLDKNGDPVSVCPSGDPEYNIVMWLDHRAKQQADFINSQKSDLLKSVGGKISPEMEPPKLLWLKQNLPDCWRKAAHFIELPDFLTYKATGSLSRSLCNLVCKWLFQADSTGKKEWSKQFMESIGLGDLLAENAEKIGNVTLAPGEPCGKGLSERAAEELGLNPGTPVGTSILDAHAGVLGCIGCVPGMEEYKLPEIGRRMVLVCGTSSCHMVVNKNAIFVPGVWGPFYSSILPKMWGSEGGQSASGKLIDFVVETHPAYREAKEMALERDQHIHSLLNHTLEDLVKSKGLGTGLGSMSRLTENLHIWPDFHGNRSPVADQDLTGMMSGLTLSSDLNDLALKYLATIQALAYGTRHIIDEMNKAGHKIEVLYICGGLRKNLVFLLTHAEITGLPVILPLEEESVLVGAAILGATASKDFKSIQDAIQSMGGEATGVRPNPTEKEYHQKKYKVFLKMLEHQREYHKIMNE